MTLDDLWPVAERISKRLRESGESIAVAESSAGGLISAALLSVPGASAYFLGGGVIYTRAARDGLLGVPETSLDGIRPSTEAYALLLAGSIRARLGATWALAETGASGPDGNRYGDPPGHACLAVVGPIEHALTVETGSAERRDNMRAFAIAGLELLEGCLAEAEAGS